MRQFRFYPCVATPTILKTHLASHASGRSFWRVNQSLEETQSQTGFVTCQFWRASCCSAAEKYLIRKQSRSKRVPTCIHLKVQRKVFPPCGIFQGGIQAWEMQSLTTGRGEDACILYHTSFRSSCNLWSCAASCRLWSSKTCILASRWPLCLRRSWASLTMSVPWMSDSSSGVDPGVCFARRRSYSACNDAFSSSNSLKKRKKKMSNNVTGVQDKVGKTEGLFNTNLLEQFFFRSSYLIRASRCFWSISPMIWTGLRGTVLESPFNDWQYWAISWCSSSLK